MLHEIKCEVDDALGILIENKKGEYSYYYIDKVTKNMLEGDGLDEWFLKETTGFEIENES